MLAGKLSKVDERHEAVVSTPDLVLNKKSIQSQEDFTFSKIWKRHNLPGREHIQATLLATELVLRPIAAKLVSREYPNPLLSISSSPLHVELGDHFGYSWI